MTERIKTMSFDTLGRGFPGIKSQNKKRLAPLLLPLLLLPLLFLLLLLLATCPPPSWISLCINVIGSSHVSTNWSSLWRRGLRSSSDGIDRLTRINNVNEEEVGGKKMNESVGWRTLPVRWGVQVIHVFHSAHTIMEEQEAPPPGARYTSAVTLWGRG